MSAGRTQDLGIQLLKQSGQPCLVFFFENIIFRDKNLDLSTQIRKIRRIKYRIVFSAGRHTSHCGYNAAYNTGQKSLSHKNVLPYA